MYSRKLLFIIMLYKYMVHLSIVSRAGLSTVRTVRLHRAADF